MEKTLLQFIKEGNRYNVVNGFVLPSDDSSEEFKKYCEQRNSSYNSIISEKTDEQKARELAGLEGRHSTYLVEPELVYEGRIDDDEDEETDL